MGEKAAFGENAVHFVASLYRPVEGGHSHLAVKRIAKFDAIDHLPRVPALLVQTGVVLVSATGAFLFRMLVDRIFPHSGPFAINVPWILLATFAGRLGAGVATLIVTTLFTWYLVVPFHGAFAFADPADGPRTFINFLAGAIVVAIVEMTRRSVRALVAEKEARIAERELLLREVNHRVKNNLAILVSLLGTQVRQSRNADTRRELNRAIGRIHSLATAYRCLNEMGDGVAPVSLGRLLPSLCEAIRSAAVQEGHVTLLVNADDWLVPHDKACSLGLLINEIVTNSVKHAFAGRSAGTIMVSLRNLGDHAELIVSDDGVGMAASGEGGGKGGLFLMALAKSAGSELECRTGPQGTEYRLRLEPEWALPHRHAA